MSDGRSKRIRRTVELHCYFGSARMCAQIVKTTSAFAASVRLSRFGETVDAKSIMSLMILDAHPLGVNFASRAITVSAAGPDAAEAIKAVVDLSPKDGGVECCVADGCGLPACLMGRDEKSFYYRCAEFERHHNWVVPA